MANIPWNKGLNKYNDERVKKYSQKLKVSRIGMKLSQKHKENISKSIKGRKPWNVGIKTPEKVRQKIVTSTSGKNNHFFGRKHSKSSINKISVSRKGKCLGIENPKCEIDLNLHKDEIIKLYLAKNSAKNISERYGVTDVTVLNYLKKWNIERRKSFYGKGVIKCEDGHRVRSYPELLIDNFLFFNGINHETNGKILNTNFRYDFYIAELDLYIEYWGLENSETYNKRKEKKLKIYEDFSLNLLSIYPDEDIVKKLKFLIPLCSNKQTTLFDHNS